MLMLIKRQNRTPKASAKYITEFFENNIEKA